MKFFADSSSELSEKVWKEIKAKTKGSSLVVGLIGDLGAGKTALVKELADRIGIADTVNSPTYNLIKVYNLPDAGDFRELCHIDIYRLEGLSASDLSEISEALGKQGTISFVEWPDKFPEIMKLLDIVVRIKVVSESKREVEII